MVTIIYLKKCESTNDAILPFLSQHSDEIMSVYTFNQTKGKGQYGNSWESAESMNVALSLAMGSDHFKLPDHLLNFHTAVLLGDFLAKMTKIPIEIKWPNDIIIKNKKVAGLLVEKKISTEIRILLLALD
ncbi:biotin--[acetyl-CoA-carboxylase] ligase [Kaistella sp. 97-N-M2]|uniref:biotin--[acetyl-CoA-carboxylase] ligase n=1 Tax=Kaistella sp. 97-N-M2 TaxID=2908645 RepID=UPI001F2C2472|nr:biotin--[acetyl-CoA-carboxylase] ligase [Kaistella sp. 97-N-M2]UJF30744.1 biotin--[acetyl-CoA-carboxylase] ligase [Kaistella sp. 97-N-M2]